MAGLDPMALMVLSQQNQQQSAPSGPGPQAQAPSAPSGPDPDALWKAATKLIHSGKFSKADVGAWLNAKTQGNIPSFDALVAHRQSQQKVQGENEMAQASDPGALATAAGGALQGASFGLLPKALGMISPEARETFESGLKAGEENHPWVKNIAEEAGGVAGGVGAGALSKGLIGPAVAQFTPGVRAGLLGATAGGMVGEAAGIADQPGQEANPIKALPQALGGALLGGFGGGLAELGIKKLNPSANEIHDFVRKSAPAGEGVFAGTGFKEGMEHLQDEADKFELVEPALKRPVGMLTRLARNTLLQKSRLSPSAAQDNLAAFGKMIQDVTAAKDKIANHPETGYDALFTAHNAEIAQNPEAIAIARSQGRPDVDGRWLEDFKQQLQNKVGSMALSKKRGEAVNNAQLKSMGSLLDRTTAVLKSVPGYEDLMANLQPYMGYLTELRKMSTKIERTQSRQMGTAASGSAEPLGMAKEALQEQAGMTKVMQRERAARTVSRGLLSAKTPEELVEHTEFSAPFAAPEAKAGGALTGGAVLPYRKVRDKVKGLLSDRE